MEFVDRQDLHSERRATSALIRLEKLKQCYQYDREVAVLKHLTSVNCSSAPKYIADFQLDENNPWIENGFVRFVVMSRLPGRPMSKVWPNPPSSPPNNETLRIWKAFRVALV